jgi:hypothetical protein
VYASISLVKSFLANIFRHMLQMRLPEHVADKRKDFLFVSADQLRITLDVTFFYFTYQLGIGHSQEYPLTIPIPQQSLHI